MFQEAIDAFRGHAVLCAGSAGGTGSNNQAVCKNLDSDIVKEITRWHDKIIKVKLSCGSMAKIVYLSGVFEALRFAISRGQEDSLLGGFTVGSGEMS